MGNFQHSSTEDVVKHVLLELKTVVAALEAKLCHATKQDLAQAEGRLSEKLYKIMAFEQDEIDAINAMSTAADSTSLKIDKVQTDVEAVLVILKNNPGTPSQALVDALAKLKTSTTTLAAGGDKLDKTIADVDAVLPTPAPAGTP